MAKFWGNGKFPYTNLNNLNLDWVIKLVLELKERVDNAYIKPVTGIPKSDLSESVQNSLNLADSALQSVPDTYRTAAEQDVIDDAQDSRIDPLYNPDVLIGGLIEFDSDVDCFIKNANISINPQQSGEGTPSVDNVRPFIDVSSAALTITGDNIVSPFNGYGTNTNKGITTTFDNEFVSISGTSTDGNTNSLNMALKTPIKLFAGITYIFAINGTWNTPNLRLRLRNESVDLWFGDSTNCVWSVIPEEDLEITRISFRVSRAGSIIDVNGEFYCNVDNLKDYSPYSGVFHNIEFENAVYNGNLVYNGNGFWTLFTSPFYSNYNGETLIGPWLSSMAEYSEDIDPPIGSQVLDLGADKNSYTIVGNDIVIHSGSNNIWSNIGSLQISTGSYISAITKAVDGKTPQSVIGFVEFSNTASKEYTINDFVLIENRLYKITQPVQIGGALVVDVNMAETTIADVLTALINNA